MSGKFCGSIMREGRWTASPYAYRYPGMNKVLQAAGRVIRTEEDLGVVLLLDDRFGTAEYTRMFPLEWSGVRGCRSRDVGEQIEAFWKIQEK